MISNTGQIQLSQDFGRYISKYAQDKRFVRYVEVGTWDGHGSTYCFHDGFRKRNDKPVLQSYEISKDRVNGAIQLWKPFSNQIQVLHARILKDVPTFESVHTMFPKLVQQWYDDDMKHVFTCPYVEPNEPQVVLLDGSEYLTYYEFQQLKMNPSIKVFMLDDTLTDKCKTIVKDLLADSLWRRVAFSDSQRNGWAIFERV